MGIASNTPTKLLGYDEFEQSAGNLEGKEPNFPSATTWAETNKTGANGFKVNASHYLERTTVSDSGSLAGCYAQLGSTSYTTFASSVAIKAGTKMMGSALSRLGLLGRYASTEKWVAAGVFVASLSPENQLYMNVWKNVSGVISNPGGEGVRIGTVALATPNTLTSDVTLTFQVASDGTWSLVATGSGLVFGGELSGQDSDLATGGALASGKAGLFDAWASATAGTRMLDSFQLLGSEPAGRVCYAGRQIEFNSNGALRQDSTGTYDGQPDISRGGDFYLDPAGESGRINRIAIRMRRNDIEVEPDNNVTDKHTVEVLVRERFLIPR